MKIKLLISFLLISTVCLAAPKRLYIGLYDISHTKPDSILSCEANGYFLDNCKISQNQLFTSLINLSFNSKFAYATTTDNGIVKCEIDTSYGTLDQCKVFFPNAFPGGTVEGIAITDQYIYATVLNLIGPSRLFICPVNDLSKCYISPDYYFNFTTDAKLYASTLIFGGINRVNHCNINGYKIFNCRSTPTIESPTTVWGLAINESHLYFTSIPHKKDTPSNWDAKITVCDIDKNANINNCHYTADNFKFDPAIAIVFANNYAYITGDKGGNLVSCKLTNKNGNLVDCALVNNPSFKGKITSTIEYY